MPASFLSCRSVDDALVRDAAARALVEHGVVRLEPLGDVVGVEDRDLGGAREARRRPSCRMYVQEIEQDAGAAPGRAPTRRRCALLAARRRRPGGAGRNGARCAATQMGPMPGPPPPCGMQNVLCRLMWQTSAPMSPGRQRPTCAFRLAPSMYTWPPCSWTIAQICWISCLEHAVRGRVGHHQRREPRRLCSPPWRARSARSMLPPSSQATTTTL